MSTRRRRRRVLSSGAEKWRTKKWLDMRLPDYIADQSIGQTPASDLTEVIGRTIDMSYMDITNNFNDYNYYLKFKITKIVGNRAKTEFVGQELNRDYRKSQIRNHRSQVEGVFNLTLKDNSRVRITAFAVTFSRAAHNTKKELRKVIADKIEEIVTELTFPAFVNKVISYELREEVFEPADEVFPVKLFEISKVKVLRLPEDRQIMDVDDLEVDEDTDLSAPETMDEDEEEDEE